jgi:hypothetical protein
LDKGGEQDGIYCFGAGKEEGDTVHIQEEVGCGILRESLAERNEVCDGNLPKEIKPLSFSLPYS